MSIGAGIFGFIQGAADAGTRIAALNLEEEKQIAKENRDSIRQKSLLDLQRRYASEEAASKYKALFDALGGADIAGSPEQLGALADAGLLRDVLGEQRAGTLRAERNSKLDTISKRFNLGISGEELSAVVDSNLTDIIFSNKNKSLTDEQVSALSEEFDVSPEAVSAIAAAGALPSLVATSRRPEVSPSLSDEESSSLNAFLSGEEEISSGVVQVGRKLGIPFKDLYDLNGNRSSGFRGLTGEQLKKLPEFSGLPQETVDVLERNPDLQEHVFKNQLTRTTTQAAVLSTPTPIYDTEEGKPIEVPLAAVADMLKEKRTDGRQRYYTGQVVETPEGTAALLTAGGMFDVGGPENVPDKTEVERTISSLRKSPVANRGMFSFADPYALNTDKTIQNARGVLNSSGATLRSFGPTSFLLTALGSNAGKDTIATRDQLKHLTELSRTLGISVTNARSSGAIIAQSDQLSPSVNVLVNILGSDESLEIKLESYRDRAIGYYRSADSLEKQGRRSGLNANARSNVAEAKMSALQALQAVDTMIASSKLSKIAVSHDPRTNEPIGRTIPLVSILRTPEDVDLVLERARKADDPFALNGENIALLLLWRSSLLARRGE